MDISNYKNFNFNPGLNLARVIQRKVRYFLWWFVLIGLILFGVYGIFSFLKNWWFLDKTEGLSLFYFSLLIMMFAFYLWQRSKERVTKINPKDSSHVEVSLYLKPSVHKLIEKTWLLSWRKNYNSIRPINLLWGFLNKNDFKKIVKRLGCDSVKINKKVKKAIKKYSANNLKQGSSLEISQELKNVFLRAYVNCLENNRSQIGELDVFSALVEEKGLVEVIFEEFGINLKQVKKVIDWRRIEKEAQKQQRNFFFWKIFKPKGKLDRAKIASVTPTLDKVSRDWTALARESKFEVVLGREDKLEKILRAFDSGQRGVILVGKSKAGKKAILKKLALLMVEEKVPHYLRDKRLVELSISSLTGLKEASDKGEEYLKKIIAEVNRAGNIILLIRDVDNLVGLKTRESGLDFSEILASGLKSRGFFFLSTASPKRYNSKIEDRVLGGFLHKVKIPVPPKELIWRILASKALIVEKELGVVFSIDALDQAIVLADNYLYGKALTAKAIDLIVEAASLVKGRSRKPIVEARDIINLVSQKTSIPLGELNKKEKEKLLNLEQLIHKRLIDQNEAVSAVSGAIRRSRLRSETKKERPIANFLFVGPTGVGKTQLAKTLAKIYFGDQDRMIRLDMSEYQNQESIKRLIGFAGDKGDHSDGYLTEAVKREPYSLLLLDEMEKAHPNILNLFLQVMEDGRLTSASGETINFKNIILIATSNAGTKIIQEKLQKGLDYLEIKETLKEEILLNFFSPEFLNRFDKLVLFKSLSISDVVKIAYLFLSDFKKRLEKKGIKFEAEQEAVEELAQAGYDAMYGARPLRRLIQDKVEDPIAKLFLKDEIKRRDKIILKQGLQFEIEEADSL